MVVNELNNQSGNLSSQGDLNLNVNKFENQKGTMVAAKLESLILVARESIDNTQGSLFGEKYCAKHDIVDESRWETNQQTSC